MYNNICFERIFNENIARRNNNNNNLSLSLSLSREREHFIYLKAFDEKVASSSESSFNTQPPHKGI